MNDLDNAAKNVLIVSGDGHATPPVHAIRGYLDPEYRIYMDDLIREDVAYIGSRATPARPPRLSLPMFDERGLVRSGGVASCKLDRASGCESRPGRNRIAW